MKIYKTQSVEFKNYKTFVEFEIQVLELQLNKKQEVIDTNIQMVKEYQLALRIPRQHYKHLEKLRYEEMIDQRDKIIKMMKKKGINYRKKGSLI